jgi:hypothetical protein
VLINPKDLVSVQKVAKEFGYDPRHFSRLAREEKFVAWQVGGTWITTRALIERYIKSNPRPGPKSK